jgi:hypothetical protein
MRLALPEPLLELGGDGKRLLDLIHGPVEGLDVVATNKRRSIHAQRLRDTASNVTAPCYRQLVDLPLPNEEEEWIWPAC